VNITILPWGPWCYSHSTPDVYRKWLRFAAANPNIEGIDLIDKGSPADGDPLIGSPARVKESRELLPVMEDLGLPVIMFVTHTDFRSETIPPAEQDRIKFLLEQAVYFKAHYFRVLTGIQSPGELFQPRVMENVIAGLRWCAALVSKTSLQLLLENNRETTDELAHICEVLRPENLRLNCEIKPPFRLGMSPYRFVQRLTEFSATYHLDNFVYDENGGDGDRTGRRLKREIPLDRGEIDVSRILRIIRDAGFDGWLSIEYGGYGEGFDDVGQSAAYLRKTWDCLPP